MLPIASPLLHHVISHGSHAEDLQQEAFEGWQLQAALAPQLLHLGTTSLKPKRDLQREPPGHHTHISIFPHIPAIIVIVLVLIDYHYCDGSHKSINARHLTSSISTGACLESAIFRVAKHDELHFVKVQVQLPGEHERFRTWG